MWVRERQETERGREKSGKTRREKKRGERKDGKERRKRQGEEGTRKETTGEWRGEDLK